MSREAPSSDRASQQEERRHTTKEALGRYKASGRKAESLYKGLRRVSRGEWDKRYRFDTRVNNLLILNALENHLAESSNGHPYYTSVPHEVEHVISRKEGKATGNTERISSVGNLVLLPPAANRKASDDAYSLKRDGYLKSGGRLAEMFADKFPTFSQENIPEWEAHLDGMLYDLLKEKLRW